MTNVMWQCVALYPASERESSLFKGGWVFVVVLVVVCEWYTERFCVRNGAKLSGWIADIHSLGVQSDKSGKFQ